MDSIIEPDATFDFSKLSLAHPVGIQGGAYFTKIEYNNKPLYIQTIKSQTRQGFVKTGKKYYCDLMFDKNAEKLIQWFENLEENCRKLIFEKRDTWFQNNLEESDIETAFNSTIRVYKSGKYYLIRTNVKNNHNNIPAVKIYNENEFALSVDDVNSDTNIISILEVQGIKFTSRNFQIEIELKQVMVLDNEPIFESCLIKTNKPNLNLQESREGIEALEDIAFVRDDIERDDIERDDETDKIDEVEKIDETDKIDEPEKIDQTGKNDSNRNSNNLEVSNSVFESLEEFIPIDTQEPLQKDDDNISFEIEDLNLDIEETDDDFKEADNLVDKLDLALENNLETIQLKKPNQVYFELYREARNKAKIAKKNALLAYLEAKNIKKTYMIENLNDSDSDIDAEIDDVSESELEDL